MPSSGIFGKLPSHGDFIQRQLPNSFIVPWDEWLQRAVHGSRELLGERWLDYYLTSPIWRFALSPGVLDEHAWAGVLVPSVDSVGRYFPLTLACASSEQRNPFAVQISAESCYLQMSELAIEALQQGLLVDDLFERMPTMPEGALNTSLSSIGREALWVSGESEITKHVSSLLEHFCLLQHQSYSLWWCAGSQYLSPTTLLSPGLPDPNLYCSMLGAVNNSEMSRGGAAEMRW